MPLRILHVLETSGGGSGRHVLDLAEQSIALGHRVHIVYSGRRMEAAFCRRLKKLSVADATRVDMHRAPHPSDFAALRSLRAYLRRYGPFDIIHGHSSKGGALARLAAIGVPAVCVYTPHALMSLDLSLNRVLRVAYALVEWCLQALADGIILVSDEERAHALQNGLSARRLFVVPNGIAPVPEIPNAQQSVRKTLNLPLEAVCIGFVGRLERQKAPERAIRAFAELAPVFPCLRLIMLGDGSMAAGLRGSSKRLGCEQQIIWLAGHNGPAVMPAFDMFLMPSRYEAFPYVLLEAAAAGLPIVATPVGGTSVVVTHGVNGYIVRPDEPGYLKETLATLVRDRDLRRAMGEQSKVIARRFTIAAMTSETIHIYRQLLQAR